MTIPAEVECRGFPTGHARTVTFYFHPDYLADQLRWLPAAHPLVHHIHHALHGDPELRTLQLASAAVRKLAPLLVRLAHPTDIIGDLAKLSMAFDVFDAVGRLSGVHAGNVDPWRTAPRREVARAISLLRADLSRAWRIDELAREIVLSPSHLARLFRTQVGVSPAEFLRQLRADRMAEVLATTSLTVGQAGAVVGWNDMAMASRSFKQRYGVPPSVYANLYRRSTVVPSVMPETVR
ncbi:AraC family transcriptional regulator [Brevibacterium ammoniilyticum]|uniref:AraC family transcriptional regulator n=1 Tax=Brevibacterium ammoniilyticum TaxID=1046555 RepID=UPI0031389084